MLAIYGKTLTSNNALFAQEVFDYLHRKQMKFVVEKDFCHLLRDELKLTVPADCFAQFDEVKRECDVLISMGGDGTILSSVTMVKDSGIPILGINFGRLGFLANIGREQIHAAVEAIENGNYMLDERSLIEVETSVPLFEDNFALNELTIQRKDQSSMITVRAFLNGELLNAYWADGLIVSTPTGSTGYSLSCGGPILHPMSSNFVLTPIAPHNLNVRPMVVNDDVVLSFEVTGRGNAFLCTLDSRFKSVDAAFQIAVRKAKFKTKLVRLNDQSFLSALKNKLHWGSDERN